MTAETKGRTLQKMTRPWQTLDRAKTADGLLELKKRADDDFLITIDGRVLMNSRASRSEAVLGSLAAQALETQGTARVLIGGLGMGCTLRATLDALSPSAEVTVAELTPAVVGWCEGELASLTGAAVADPRVSVVIGDVADCIAAAAPRGRVQEPGSAAKTSSRYDAIVLDLYEGPQRGAGAERDPCFGRSALEKTARALAPGGIFGVWGEARDPKFEKRLTRAGFRFELHKPGRGGLRHAVYLARAGGSSRRSG